MVNLGVRGRPGSTRDSPTGGRDVSEVSSGRGTGDNLRVVIMDMFMYETTTKAFWRLKVHYTSDGED